MTGARPIRALACALGLLAPLGVVVCVNAQELPPVGPAGDEPTAVPGLPGGAVEEALAGLAINASLGGGWDSNATFVADGIESATAFGNAGLARTWVSPTWTTVANASAGGSVYRITTATSRYQLGAGLSTSGTLGAQTTLTLGAGGGISYTDVLSDPATAGLVLPITRSRTLTGNVALGRTLGALTQLSLNGGYGRYFFDSEDLTDSAGISAGAALTRTLSPRSTVSFSYGLSSNEYGEADRSQAHNLSAGFGRTLGSRTSLSLSAGAGRSGVQGGGGRWIFSGSAGYSLQGDQTSLSLSLSRSIAPAPGLGQDRILNMLSVAFASTLRPWATLTLTGGRSLNQDPADPDLSYSTDTFSLGVRLRLTQTLGLAPQLRYRRRGEINENPAVSSFSVGLGLDFSSFVR